MEEAINLDSENEISDNFKQETDKVMLKDVYSVTIKESDYHRLDSGRYLNDNLIDFFLNLFIHKKKSFYAFNSFFFNTFIEFGFEKVRKWCKSIDLFKMKYWIVPIAQNGHWVLVIITNPKNSLINKTPQTSFLLFDSLDLKQFNPQKEITSFIEQEWKSRTGKDTVIEYPPLIMLKLPLQDNLYDCGVFLLKYAEIFVSNPKIFSQTDESFEELFDVQNMNNQRWLLKNAILDFCEGINTGKIKNQNVIRIKICEEIETSLKELDSRGYNLRRKMRKLNYY